MKFIRATTIEGEPIEWFENHNGQLCECKLTKKGKIYNPISRYELESVKLIDDKFRNGLQIVIKFKGFNPIKSLLTNMPRKLKSMGLVAKSPIKFVDAVYVTHDVPMEKIGYDEE